MLHTKQHISDLSEICFRKGVKYIVISPGSRNAPLIDAFHSRFGERCISIVDERSAGYFALGLARYLKNPVALICTSGTAVLNYSPALAEAYYTRIPLLAITADRPAEWIDQQDNQTVRQNDVYRNFIKKSFLLPEIVDSMAMLQKTHKQIQHAIEFALYPPAGPIHINVPLREPLFEELPAVSEAIRMETAQSFIREISIPDILLSQWKSSGRIMIVHGHDCPESGIGDSLVQLAKDPRVVVFAENISNTSGEGIIANPELLFSLSDKLTPKLPELLLYSGGQIVSKQLKQYLRAVQNLIVWRIGVDHFPMDTFKQSNTILPIDAERVYNKLAGTGPAGDVDGYKDLWQNAYNTARYKRNELLKQAPFSDLTLMDTILKYIPSGSILEYGNSSPIRYSQYFDNLPGVQYFANRGVSGIDGCLSSAAGTAYASRKLTVAVAGDLSFVYDSNALWNRKLPPNLRMVVINNKGGGIFSLLDGLAAKVSFTEFIEAAHPVNIQKLAEAFNIDYYCIDDRENLFSVFPGFLEKSKQAKILEIRTKSENNSLAYNLISGKA